MVNLPNFLIVGAAKSGTTSLYYYLKDHPEIFLSPVKEPCFFSAQTLTLPQKGIRDGHKTYIKSFGDYCRLFHTVQREKAIGEASCDTLYYYRDTIPVIRKYLGDPKIIIMLRNPVDRAFSAYVHMIRDEREHLSFEDGLRFEEQRLANNWQCMWSYRMRGMYFNQMDAFLSSFTTVKIILYDDFKKNSIDVIRQVFEFLEVDASYVPSHLNFRYNVTGIPRYKYINRVFLMRNIVQRIIRTIGIQILTEDRWVRIREDLRSRLMSKPEMGLETRRGLREVFRDDIICLQRLINRDLSAWLNGA